VALAKILLAYKDRNLREEWTNYLHSKGFEVLETDTFAEARKKSREQIIDLAIIDLHLSKEGGPLAAGRAIHHTVPTIIVTEAPTSEMMRDSFRRKPGSMPPAADVIDKEEGIEAVFEALQRALTPRVFVAYGHDSGAKDEVVRLLKALELRPVVLSEKAEAGRTIIEKIENYSDVEFAVILLTPDDVGGTDSTEIKPRARQNVIFELGYFFAKLGRKKVVALCKDQDGELEMPSNYSGILYLPMDSTGGWKMRLAEEMAEANFEIDLNQVLRA
jgi:DNA-binding NarL/FixJ family response regulator